MLKTDYKDAMYDGARKYRITANADGTSGIVDETAYTQEGDPFGANDINTTNAPSTATVCSYGASSPVQASAASVNSVT